MAQQVQLPNSISILLCLLALGCKQPVSEKADQALIKVNSSVAGFTNMNGMMHLNRQPFSGTIYTLFENSQDTAEIQNYYQGREHGLWKKYAGNGSLRSSRTFTNGKKTGVYNSWWPNGVLQQHYLFKNDEYEGTCKEWNEHGILVKEMNYLAGHEEGSQKMFYDNGQARANYIIKNGRRYGLLGTKNCINVSDSIFK